MPDLFEKQTRQEPSPVYYRRYIPNPVMSGGEDLLSDAVVTVHPLPGRRDFKRATTKVQPKFFIEAAPCVVHVAQIPNDKHVAMEAQVYKGA
jgi:hypothetical protein